MADRPPIEDRFSRLTGEGRPGDREGQLPLLLDLIAGLAQDAVRTQMLLDEDYIEQLQQFAATTPSPWQQDIAPVRQYVAELEVDAQMRVEIHKRVEVSICAGPLSIWSRVLSDWTTDRHSSVCLTVQQAPL